MLPKLVVLGLLLATAWQFREMMLAANSNHWPSVRGTVLDAWFDETRDAEDDVTHTANVRYRFKVKGRDYESSRLSYQPTQAALFSDVVGMLRGVIKGKEVDVYYDPANPARSVLVPGGNVDNVLRVLVPLAVAVWLGWIIH